MRMRVFYLIAFKDKLTINCNLICSLNKLYREVDSY